MDRAFGRQDLQQRPIDVIEIRYPEHFRDLYSHGPTRYCWPRHNDVLLPPDTAGRERAE